MRMGEAAVGRHAFTARGDIFAPFLAAPPERPFVVAQLGQSLDGRIATLSGESQFLNSAAALDHLHRLRAHVDAVVVGARTVVTDDPQLTVRRVRGRNPARVVIDPTGRLPAAGRWLARDGTARLVVSASAHGVADAQMIRLALADGMIAPATIVAALFQRGFRRLLIEGGARTVSAFLDAGCVDRLHLLVAPMIIGSGKSGFDLLPVPRLEQALRPQTRLYVFDDGDVLFDCDLRTGAESMP